MNIVIVHDQVPEGASEDEQDTLVQCAAVFDALTDLGHIPVLFPFSLNCEESIRGLREVKAEMAFNLVESVSGQGRLIHTAPAILDVVHLPYTGSRTEAIFLSSNKLLAKRVLALSGIATPEWITQEYPDAVIIPDGRTYIIKSVWEHASKGLNERSIVRCGEDGTSGDTIRYRLEETGGECFAEVFIEGREFNISLLENGDGPMVLPAAEIRFMDYPEGKHTIVDYRAKWEKDSFEYRHTIRSFEFVPDDAPLLKELGRIATRCWHIFGLRGYARVDFRVDRAGIPWVLEINTNPCIAPDAGFTAAAERAGLGYTEVVDRIIRATPLQ